MVRISKFRTASFKIVIFFVTYSYYMVARKGLQNMMNVIKYQMVVVGNHIKLSKIFSWLDGYFIVDHL